MWRLYIQEFEEHGEKRAILIMKTHHSLMDGVSSMCQMLACSGEYDRSYLVKSRDATMLERCMLRLSVPFMLPKLVSTSLLARSDSNFLTKDKQLSGIINCKSTKDFDF